MTTKLVGVYELQEGQYKNNFTDLSLTLKKRVKPSATKPPFYFVIQASGGHQTYLSSLYPLSPSQPLSEPLRVFKIDDREGNKYRVTFSEDFLKFQIQKNPPKTPRRPKERDLTQELRAWSSSASSIINAEKGGKFPPLYPPESNPFDPLPQRVTPPKYSDKSGQGEGGSGLW